MQKSKILVTGGAGYIGSHVVLALRDAGYEPVVLDDLSTGSAALVPQGVTFYHGDVADVSLLTRIFAEHKIAALMHFAAKLIVPESVANPGLYYHNNMGKFTVLLNETAAARIPHVIFSSTAAVYGEPETLSVTEDAIAQPINPYGASKLMAERVLTDIARAQDMRYVTLRYFNVAGADPAGRAGQMMPNATHLIKVAAETAVGKRDHVQIFGTDYATPDGTCIRDYIHVSDLADAHVKALQYLENDGASVTLNCGYGHGASVMEVIAAMRNASSHPVPTVVAPRRAGDPAALVAASAKLRALLNWQPHHDNLQEIVQSALAWEMKQK